VIPLFVGLIGSAFALSNSIAIHNRAFSIADLVGVIWIPGLLIPSLCWLSLTWLAHRTQSVINAYHHTTIDTARQLAESQRRVASLETASLLGQQETAHLEMDALLVEMVRLVREKLNCYQAHILLVDEENQELVLKKSSGRSDVSLANQDLRLKIGKEGITGWVAQTGETLLCNDVSCDPRYLPVEFAPAVQSELAVPLRIGNRVIGVLDAQSDERNAFDQDDVALLQMLGNQVGRAIENARLYYETKYRYDAMIALHDTSLDMIAQLDTPRLLEALLRRGAHLLGARFSSLFLYDPASGSIRNVANFNSWRDWTGVTLKPGQGAIGQVILTGKPLIVNDYGNWIHRQVLESTPHTMVMCAPLRWQEQIIGGIGVVSEPNARPFNQNDLWLLGLFAD
jgi:GAF domain-containing protein